jgi:hypothetical protein
VLLLLWKAEFGDVDEVLPLGFFEQEDGDDTLQQHDDNTALISEDGNTCIREQWYTTCKKDYNIKARIDFMVSFHSYHHIMYKCPHMFWVSPRRTRLYSKVVSNINYQQTCYAPSLLVMFHVTSSTNILSFI